MRDDTEKKFERTTDELHSKMITQLMDHLDVCIYVSRLDTHELLFANKKLRDDFSLGESVAGKVCWQVLQAGRDGPCDFCPKKELVERGIDRYTWSARNSLNGRYYQNTDCLIRWVDGNIVHMENSVDITDIKNAEVVAAKASGAKSEFLSRMSHEIRTPMNAIISLSQIARRLNDLPKIHNYLDKIGTSSRYLLEIVNDVFDMSKIETNNLRLINILFDFEKMMMNLSEQVMPKTDEKQQNLLFHIDKGLCMQFIGDELRLSQVIGNLLSNATKFTPAGGTITLDARVREHRGERGEKVLVEVSISDTGVGIASDNLDKLFVPFEQVEGGGTRRYGGTGLGLAISKHLVGLMGGDIWVESTKGAGSTFTFTAELQRAGEKSSAAPRPDLCLDEICVLHLDTNQETRLYFKQIMENFKIRSESASNLEEALALAERRQREGTPFDIVFIDWSLPGSGSMSVAHAFSQHHPQCVIIPILPASKWSEIESKAQKMSIPHFLVKPFFPSTLLDTLYRCLEIDASCFDFKKDPYALNLKGHHLLVAEDMDINQEIVRVLLDHTQAKLTFAGSGQEVIDAFTHAPEEYDLILMDLRMPQMDGYEATRAIRSLDNEKAKTIPIVAMSADAFQEDIEKCFEAGMNDHISKPIEELRFYERLSHYLKPLSEETPASANIAPQRDEPRTPEPDARLEPQEPLKYQASMSLEELDKFKETIDIKEGLHQCNHNRKLFVRLLSSFRDNDMFSRLCGEIEREEYAEAVQTAHAMKAITANLGMYALNEKIRMLENMLQNGVSESALLDKIAQQLGKTRDLIPELAEAIREETNL